MFLDFLQVKNLHLNKEFILQFFRGHNETPNIYARSRTHAHIILAFAGTVRMSDGSDGRKQRLYMWY